jgi:hypothetical protein
MKTTLLLTLLFLVSGLVSGQQIGDLILPQKTAATGPHTARFVPTSEDPTLFGSSDYLPVPFSLGSGFAVVDGELQFTPSVTWNDVTGKPSTFAPAAHTQAWSTITGTPNTVSGYGISDALTTSVAASTYALIAHDHAISDVTDLQDALDAKLASTTAASTYAALGGSYSNPSWITALAWSKLSGVPDDFTPSAHVHAIEDVTDLQDALDAKLASTTAASTYAALGGSYSNPSWITALAWSKLSGVPDDFTPSAHVHAIEDVTDLQDALDAKLATTTAASTYALIAHDHAISDVTGLQDALDAKLASTTAASTYAALGGSYSNPSWITGLAWSKLSDVPSTFTPSAHVHDIEDVTDLQDALDARLLADPGVAYIRTDGSDSTGDGSPGKPFRNWQKAIDAGFRNFDFGVGSFGNANFNEAPGPLPFIYTITGRGVGVTVLGNVNADEHSVISFRILQAVTLGGITCSATGDGALGGQVELFLGGSYCSSVNCAGGYSEEGTGGNGGIINVTGPGQVGSMSAAGGGGGSGSGADGGVNISYAILNNYPSAGQFGARFSLIEGDAVVELNPE